MLGIHYIILFYFIYFKKFGVLIGYFSYELTKSTITEKIGEVSNDNFEDMNKSTQSKMY